MASAVCELADALLETEAETAPDLRVLTGIGDAKAAKRALESFSVVARRQAASSSATASPSTDSRRTLAGGPERTSETAIRAPTSSSPVST